jgi:LPXTG-motif cell wall-anchored protein
LVATTVAGPDGTWSVTLDEPLSCGDHVITATQTLNGMTSVISAPATISVECPGGPGHLPATGSSGALRLVAVIGAALAAFGVGLLRLRRRMAA